MLSLIFQEKVGKNQLIMDYFSTELHSALGADMKTDYAVSLAEL